VYSLGLTFSVATRLGPFVPAAVRKFWRIGASWIAPQGRKRAAEAGQKPVRAIKVFAMHSCAGELRGMQLTENFGFLGEHDPDLVKIGALAEPIFVTIPRPPIKLRQFAELLSKLIAGPGARTGHCPPLASRHDPEWNQRILLRPYGFRWEHSCMPVTDRQGSPTEVANRRRFPLLEHRCATEGAKGAIWNFR
jgi:hypothetical protein